MQKAFDLDYANYYDLFNDGKNYVQEVDFLDEVFKKYSKKEIKNVLNLGCGTGMHDILLSKKGYSINGMDISKDMINIAKQRNISNATFQVGNMSDFSLNREFEACIIMFAAFGYLNKNEEIESSLRNIHKHLKENGLLVIEVWNGLGVMRELPTSRKKEIVNEHIKIKRQSFPELDSFNHKVNIQFEVEIFKDDILKKNYQERHNMRFFFPQEIIYFLNKANFEVLEICDTFKLGTKIDENNWNMVIIARSR